MHTSSSVEAVPVGVVTVVEDQMDSTELFRCAGAVVLPPGTVVELADGEHVAVTSLRLVAPSPGEYTARLVVRVAPACVGLLPASNQGGRQALRSRRA
ncbi:hypothetical protein [Amycolatopsis thermoflava]|uniref:hypothetical protein n=1 Tax=Amycolatopsis thermoflava TaxID=84480 RepID=UPI003EBF2459